MTAFFVVETWQPFFVQEYNSSVTITALQALRFSDYPQNSMTDVAGTESRIC
jgi:hypothetical protein